MATVMSGMPNVPKFAGAESFEGEQQHSSQHPGPDAYAGKKCVIVGSNNSAHDIAAALWEHDADVTMLQRSSTHIVKSDSLMEEVLGPLYSEEAVAGGLTHEKADLLFASIPYKVLPDFQRPAFEAIKQRDAAFYQKLEDAGFMLDFGDDESGLFLNICAVARVTTSMGPGSGRQWRYQAAQVLASSVLIRTPSRSLTAASWTLI